jgi:hypothetical protein
MVLYLRFSMNLCQTFLVCIYCVCTLCLVIYYPDFVRNNIFYSYFMPFCLMLVHNSCILIMVKIFNCDLSGAFLLYILKPDHDVVLLFCCLLFSSFAAPTCRIVEEWSSKYRAEELYMMKPQTDELIKCLSSATDNFPSSCSSLEGMCLSSLGR